MKAGANKTDQINIAKMKKAGSDASTISKTLSIQKKVVNSFIDFKKESTATK